MLKLKPRKQAVCPDGPFTLEFLVWIDPDELPPRKARERSPVNLALVLDRSQSMEGEKFELMLEAACRAVESVQPTDGLAIVLFDDDVYTIYAGKAEDKAGICKGIRELTVGSCTNLHGGWARGAELLPQIGEPRQLSRVVLFTDGQANRGIVEPLTIYEDVKQWHRRGVQTTTLGFGRGYNENLLREMAGHGQGNHAYIEDAGKMSAFFEQEMSSLLQARGTNVRLRVHPAEGAEFRWLGEMNEEEGSVMLANLVPGEQLAVMGELRFEGEVSTSPVAVELSWMDLETHEDCRQRVVLELPSVDREIWETMPSDPEVESQLARSEAENRRKAAMYLLREYQFDAALLVLDYALELEALPEDDRNVIRDLIRTVEGGDEEAGLKKAAMYSHGHGHGHARTVTAYVENTHDLQPGQRITLPFNLTPSLFERQDQARVEWTRVAGMLRGHFYGERLVRGSRSGLGEGAILSKLTLDRLLQYYPGWLRELPRILYQAEVTYPTTSLQKFRRAVDKSVGYYELGSPSAGCAALRRVCPFLATGRPYPQLDAAFSTLLTHRDNMAVTASAGYAVLLSRLLRLPKAPAPEFYLNTFLRAIEGMEQGEPYTCAAPSFRGWEGHLIDFLPMAFKLARDNSFSVTQAKQAWGSGPYLLEVVPTLLYALELHGHDRWRALEEAIEGSMEADTLGMLVGACLGALHGSHKGWFIADELEGVLDQCRMLEVFAG